MKNRKKRNKVFVAASATTIALCLGLIGLAATSDGVMTTSTDAGVTGAAAIGDTSGVSQSATVVATTATTANDAAATDNSASTTTGVTAGASTTTPTSDSAAYMATTYPKTGTVSVKTDSDHDTNTYAFSREGNDTYYLINGVKQTGFVKINKEDLYYFDPQTAKMVTGWATIDGNTFYFSSTGIALKDGFFNIDGQDYYFNKDGLLQKGFKKVDGDRYYLEKNDGERKYGFQWIDGNLFYMNPGSGEVATGWFDVDGKTYYASSTGYVVKNQTKYIDKNVHGTVINGKYKFDENGAMVTGFVMNGNNLNYYDEDYGLIYEGGPGVTNGCWFDSDDGWICADGTSGKLYRNKFAEVTSPIDSSKTRCAFDENGILVDD